MGFRMIQPNPVKITIDTNCVVGLFDLKTTTATSVPELRDLMRQALSSELEIALTTRVEVDLSRDKDPERRREMLAHLQMFPVIGTVARWDQSKLDGADVLAGPEHAALLEEIQRIVFPGLTADSGRALNKIADVDHLVGHKLAGRDIFVTDDKGILKRSTELRDGPGILVMNPSECLMYIEEHRSRSQKKQLVPNNADERYWDKRLKGSVTFDYSNNDHRFFIGEGLNLFETRWSKASDREIYAYRDPPSIESIAFAKGCSEISDITDADAFDYSSRTRRPKIGQIIIWRNINGLCAATKILSIKDDSRRSDVDELSFEFVILPDGTRNFSH